MYRNLRGLIRQRGLTQNDIAYVLKLSSAAVSGRMCGRTPWSIDEIYTILDFCGVPEEEMHIYFPRNGGGSKDKSFLDR